ncbi:hypothetical protein KWF36_16035 [Acinetobacter pittii]|uniref:HNH endonuclease n=1 Tax=Acinetobacter pittii TaxID=48296 RepID=UPI00355B7072
MSDIKRQISFSARISNILKQKTKDPCFKYTDWSGNDLEEVRKTIRNFYRKEQNGKCSYCRKDLSLQSASNCHVEHILPKSKNLKFIFEPKNLCVICADCNEIKREKETVDYSNEILKKTDIKLYPRASNSFLIVHPHFDNYDDHIKILCGGHYIDMSPKGHRTIGVCRLNRFLHEFGWPDEPSTLDEILTTAKKLFENDDPLTQTRVIKQLGVQINSNSDIFT